MVGVRLQVRLIFVQTVMPMIERLLQTFTESLIRAQNHKNPLNLPGKCPGDNLHGTPSSSRRGHINIISDLRAKLAFC